MGGLLYEILSQNRAWPQLTTSFSLLSGDGGTQKQNNALTQLHASHVWSGILLQGCHSMAGQLCCGKSAASVRTGSVPG
jgi:hypothetical protein